MNKKLAAMTGGWLFFLSFVISLGWLASVLVTAGSALLVYAFLEELGSLALHAHDKVNSRAVKDLKTNLHTEVKGFYVLQHKESNGEHKSPGK